MPDSRIFILDVDAHHGNGVQDAFYNTDRVLTISLHESGETLYPGTGFENLGPNGFNYPVAPRTPRGEYRKVLTRALEDLKAFQADLVGVSAGFE
jgi:acetoin utilization deacetylase AcuC-like enzyme